MFNRFFKRKPDNIQQLFNGHFIEVKSFYVYQFNSIPCISFIGETDTNKAFSYIQERYNAVICKIYQHAYFEHQDKRMYFNNTVVVLNNKRIIEIGNNYCQLLHAPEQYNWANSLIEVLAGFKEVKEEEKSKIVRVIGFARDIEKN